MNRAAGLVKREPASLPMSAPSDLAATPAMLMLHAVAARARPVSFNDLN